MCAPPPWRCSGAGTRRCRGHEKQSGRLVIRTAAGLAADLPESLPAEHRFAELVIEHNRTASLNDASLRPDPTMLAIADGPAFQSVLAAPMQAQGQAFGAVAVYSEQKHEWPAEHFRLTEWLATQSAHILDILRLQSDLRRQAALLDLSPDGIIVRRLDGTITSWSHGAEALYGWTKAEAVGQNDGPVAEHAVSRTARTHQPEARGGRPMVGRGDPRDEGRARGRRRKPMADRTRRGGPDRPASGIERRPDRPPASGGSAAPERRAVADGHDAAEIGVWSWTPGTNQVVVSANWRRLFGVPSDVPITFETWAGALHPDDRERAVRQLNDASRQHREFESEYRAVLPDRTMRWMIDRGRAWYNEAGDAVGMAGVNIDITERKRALDALRESDRRKSEFLATLSHELRNPLAPIRYALELLRCEGDDGSPAHPKRVIERQLGHLVHLVDDLLDLTRIASNKIRLRKRHVDLAGIIQHAVEATAPDIEQANHSLVVSLPPEPLWIEADPDRLAQVMTNLLNNAARYTPQGGRLAITAAAVHDQVVISVSDTGIGLRPEDRDRVFEMFTQVGEPGQGGLGIGLALVKGLVALHGGTVEARSKGPGQGSQFLIRLPRAHAPAPDGPAQGRAEGTTATGRRVLVVDDNFDSADMLKTLLELHGHEVRVANDGPSALAMLEEFAPHIGLFDIGLPGMSGYELARRVRARIGEQRMYLVAVTGWGQEEDRQRAREYGFNAHLTKPADPEELQRLIARAEGFGR